MNDAALRLELRTRCGVDTVLVVDTAAGLVCDTWDGTPKMVAEFAAGADSVELWDDGKTPACTSPDSFGELVAHFDGEVVVHDAALWADRCNPKGGSE